MGENVFPVTLELDITSECSRKCPACPSSRSENAMYLDKAFIEKLFSALEGQTEGLLMTGGETTMDKRFPEIIKLANTSGFKEIAVVTNGNHLDEEKVANALLEYASTIRMSMYDWNSKSCEGTKPSLGRIERLRNKIEKLNSNLKIGISILTSKKKKDALYELTEKIKAAGAHWVYFHPMCVGWEGGAPVQVKQEGVLTILENIKSKYLDGFNIFYSKDRYKGNVLNFNGYHAAHFLLIVGDDGKNYLGAEVKYNEKYIVADFKKDMKDGFLWRRERFEGINEISSKTYSAIGSRHRGVLYSDLIEKILNKNCPTRNRETDRKFLFPHIL